MSDPSSRPIDPAVLKMLRCPVTHSPLRQEGDELVAEQPSGAGLRYPIRDGIPVLLESEAALPEGVESMEAFRAKYVQA